MGTETLIFRGSPSLLTRSGSLFLAFVAMVAGGVLAIQMDNHWFWALSAAALLFAIIQVVLVRSLVYEVTTERIRMRRGILTRRTEELELYRVRDMTLLEPFALRITGRGHLDLTTMDPSHPRLTLQAIKRPDELREKLRTHIEECRARNGVRVTEFSDEDAPPPAM